MMQKYRLVERIPSGEMLEFTTYNLDALEQYRKDVIGKDRREMRCPICSMELRFSKVLGFLICDNWACRSYTRLRFRWEAGHLATYRVTRETRLSSRGERG